MQKKMSWKTMMVVCIACMAAFLLSGCAQNPKEQAMDEPAVQQSTAAPTLLLTPTPEAAPTPEPSEQPTPEATIAPAPEFVKANQLTLYIQDSTVLIGKTTNMKITVLCGEDVEEDICIYDEYGDKLRTIENKGRGTYESTVQVYESEARMGSLYAMAGDVKSREVSFCVQPQVTEEMVERLDEACLNLAEYMGSLDFEEPYCDEALDAAQAWLSSQEQIQTVSRVDPGLFFFTDDGLVGAYGIHGDESADGAGFMPAEDVYEAYTKGESVSHLYIDSERAFTNKDILLIVPQTPDDAMDQFVRLNEEILSLFADWSGGSFTPLREEEAWTRIASGDFTDCGLLVFGAHGVVINVGDEVALDSSNELLLTMNMGHNSQASRSALGLGDVNWLWGSPKRVRAYKEIKDGATLDQQNYAFLEDMIGDPEYVHLCITRYYLEEVLSDKTFDNTVVFMFVCEFLADPQMAELFFDHGASVIIGNWQEFKTLPASAYLLNMLDSMGLGASVLDSFEAAKTVMEEYRAAYEVWRDSLTPTPAPTPSPIPTPSPTATPTRTLSPEEILAMSQGGVQHAADARDGSLSDERVRNYNSQSVWEQLTEDPKDPASQDPAEVPLIEAAEEADEAELTLEEYYESKKITIGKFEDELPAEIRLRDGALSYGEYAMDGYASLSGTVVDDKEEPVAQAEIRLYKWMNHAFELTKFKDGTGAELDVVLTDEAGRYSIAQLPVGMYIIDAQKGSAHTWVGLSMAQDAYEQNLVLPSSKLIVTTQVQRHVNAGYDAIGIKPICTYGGDPGIGAIVTLRFLSAYHAYENELPARMQTALGVSDVDMNYKSYDDLWIEDVYATDSAVSFQISQESYTMGGAHGSHAYDVVNLDLVTGERLTLEQILDPDNDMACGRLKTLWRMQLENMGAIQWLWEDAETVLEEGLKGNIGLWRLSEEGLVLFFRPYEAAPYSAGTMSVTIPYAQLTGILNEKYLPVEEQAQGVLQGDCVRIDVHDQRRDDSRYTEYGDASGILLAVDGTVTQMKVVGQVDKNAAINKTVLFYATSLTNGLVWVPDHDDVFASYEVTWYADGVKRTLLIEN